MNFIRWYLTYEHGNSSKFYEVIYHDGRFATRWGRIGAPKGQMQVTDGGAWDASQQATKKRDKGYEWEDHNSSYALSSELVAALTDAFDMKDAGLLAHVVNSALKEAIATEAVDDAGTVTVTERIDLLVTQAQNLVPLMASDPAKYATDLAEIREGAESQREKLRRLDVHLETLHVLLTA